MQILWFHSFVSSFVILKLREALTSFNGYSISSLKQNEQMSPSFNLNPLTTSRKSFLIRAFPFLPIFIMTYFIQVLDAQLTTTLTGSCSNLKRYSFVKSSENSYKIMIQNLYYFFWSFYYNYILLKLVELNKINNLEYMELPSCSWARRQKILSLCKYSLLLLDSDFHIHDPLVGRLGCYSFRHGFQRCMFC